MLCSKGASPSSPPATQSPLPTADSKTPGQRSEGFPLHPHHLPLWKPGSAGGEHSHSCRDFFQNLNSVSTGKISNQVMTCPITATPTVLLKKTINCFIPDPGYSGPREAVGKRVKSDPTTLSTVLLPCFMQWSLNLEGTQEWD